MKSKSEGTMPSKYWLRFLCTLCRLMISLLGLFLSFLQLSSRDLGYYPIWFDDLVLVDVFKCKLHIKFIEAMSGCLKWSVFVISSPCETLGWLLLYPLGGLRLTVQSVPDTIYSHAPVSIFCHEQSEPSRILGKLAFACLFLVILKSHTLTIVGFSDFIHSIPLTVLVGISYITSSMKNVREIESHSSLIYRGKGLSQ